MRGPLKAGPMDGCRVELRVPMLYDPSDCGHGVILLTTDIWDRRPRGARDGMRGAER